MFPNHSDNIFNTNRNHQTKTHCYVNLNKQKFDSRIFHLAEVFPSDLYMDFKAFF